MLWLTGSWNRWTVGAWPWAPQCPSLLRARSCMDNFKGVGTNAQWIAQDVAHLEPWWVYAKRHGMHTVLDKRHGQLYGSRSFCWCIQSHGSRHFWKERDMLNHMSYWHVCSSCKKCDYTTEHRLIRTPCSCNQDIGLFKSKLGLSSNPYKVKLPTLFPNVCARFMCNL